MKHKILPFLILAMLISAQSLMADDETQQDNSFFMPLFEKAKLPDRHAGIDYTVKYDADETLSIFSANAAYSFNRYVGVELTVPYEIYAGYIDPDHHLGMIDTALRGAVYPVKNSVIGYGISLLLPNDENNLYKEDYYAAPYLTGVYQIGRFQGGISGTYEYALKNDADDSKTILGGHAMVRVWRSLHIITELQRKTVEIKDFEKSYLDFAAGIRFDANKSDNFKVGLGIQVPVDYDEYDFKNTMSFILTF
jgi:hypothetical protein